MARVEVKADDLSTNEWRPVSGQVGEHQGREPSLSELYGTIRRAGQIVGEDQD
jgi:hypothetical protein